MGKIQSVNKETIELVKKLRQKTKESQQGLWKDIAKRLDRTRRYIAKVNLEKLEKLAQSNPGKILLVPGKVLGKGILVQKVKIAAMDYSAKAKAEINKNGKAISLEELMNGKDKPSDIIIVK
ncbi:MAG: 50S ribosomal protein L18e [Candidatus Diapherotrites archaeon]|nr:50S ribosomal protein L18e [Candidatus Diapherotrites archaeon]